MPSFFLKKKEKKKNTIIHGMTAWPTQINDNPPLL